MTSSVLCVICRKSLENKANDSNQSQLLLLKAYRDLKCSSPKEIDFSSETLEDEEENLKTFDHLRGKPVSNAVSVCNQHANHFLCLRPCAMNYLSAAVTDKCPVCRGDFCDAAQTIFDAFFNKRLYQNLASHLQVARQQYRELIIQESKKLANRICQKDLDFYQKQQRVDSTKPLQQQQQTKNCLPISVSPVANIMESFQVSVNCTLDSITWTRKEDGASLSSQMRVSSKQWPLQITSTDLQILCRNMLSLHLSITADKELGQKQISCNGSICLSFEMIQMLCRVNQSRLLQEIDFVFRVPPEFELLSLAPLAL